MDTNILAELIKKESPSFKGEIKWFETTDSTNNQAKEFAIHGKECLIVARKQDMGRGRYDRTFESNEGGLYMSLCLRISKDKIDEFAQDANEDDRGYFALGERLLKYPVQAGEAVAKALREAYMEDFDVKPPNDILLRKKKVCGILIEAVHHDEDIFIIFGIGINQSNSLSANLTDAANLAELTGKKVQPEILCVAVTKEIISIL